MSNTTEFDNINFDLPKNQSNVIKVIGVGGGGSNAINHMFQQGIKGVDFVICNTDAQALENSPVPNRIQLGVSLTEGLGAGANPEIGKQSAIESLEEIQGMLATNTKMVFITAGMGGGTGTGAAPVIAQMAKEMDILTVGIVTIPFQFEGKTRNAQAQEGVEKLRRSVDSLIVINNNKLRDVYGNLGFKAGFSKADEVLATAARGIAEVITHHYTQNIDLRDAKTVLSDSGTAIMGSSSASGANRASEAITKALDSPLLNDNKIRGAKNVLLLIVSGSDEITIDEIGEISDHIQEEAGHGANIIMGVGEDESLESAIAITVIATGFNAEQQNEIVNVETKKIIHTLEDEQKAEQSLYSAPTTHREPEIQEIKPETSEVRHTLFDLEENQQETQQKSKQSPFEGYVKTTEFLRNMSVSFEEIGIEVPGKFHPNEVNQIDVKDFIIIEAADSKQNMKKESEVKAEKIKIKKESDLLAFDFPIQQSPAQSSNYEAEQESVNINEIEVHEMDEIVPESEDELKIKRYTLEDYEEVEQQLTQAKPSTNMVREEETPFIKRTTPQKEIKEKSDEEAKTLIEDSDPFNTPISQILRERTEERKRKMKEFNYKFRNSNSHLEEIEKQPAYKRMGIELDSSETDSGLSRTSINSDGDEIELRKNNSFLHDNVD